MKLFSIVLVVFTAVLFAVAAPVQAQTDNTFDGSEGDDWNTPLNWSREHPPRDDENAIIPVTKTPFIGRNDTGVCQIITLAGTLLLKKDSVLTIGQQDLPNSSTISGTMTIGKQDDPNKGPATLKISGDHTITGDDGTIELVRESVIDDNGHGGDELTIEGSCEVGCDEGDPPTTDCSLTVTGQGTIEVKLYNDAFVIAEGATLILDDGDKDSGCCGSWVAGPAGELHVLCDVSGSATWVADDLSAAGKFVIGDGDTDSGCVTATADVILTGGWQTVVLHVQSNGHFCTQGRLKYKSLLNEPSSPTTPQIRVETDRMAAFGVSSCSCP